MKAILIMLIFTMPVWAIAGNGKLSGNERKSEKVDIRITTGKNGKIEITGLDNKALISLEKEINEALKNVDIKIEDGKEKHEVHFAAELKIK